MASTSNLVSDLRSTANSFKSGVQTRAEKMKTALNKIDTTVTSVEKKMKDLRSDIVKGEESAIAQENLMAIEEKINKQLGSYIRIRRSVLGVIKDFDINLARESTISKLSEELWLSSSRYWLSSAFIAISAWVQNNEELCQNAVKEALRRDKIRTPLFFCLLNLRFGDHRASRAWLKEFFYAIDGAHPPRETAILIQSYLYGVFGKDPQLDATLQDAVNRWTEDIGNDKEMSDELVEDFCDYIKTLPTKNSDAPSGVLYDCCSNLNELENSFKEASRYESALARIKELDAVEEGNILGPEDIVKKVDKLLDDLVNSYDEEEQQLRNEKKYYELVKAHDGDREAAKQAYDKYIEKFGGDKVNISKQMLRWAVYPENEDISVQKYAMQKTKDWYVRAVNNYDAEIKNQVPKNFNLTIDLWNDVVDGKDREAIKKNMHDKFMEARSKEVIFTKRNIVFSALAAILLIVGCVFSMITYSMGASWFFVGYIVGPVSFAVFGGIVAYTTIHKVRAFPKRIEKANKTLDKCLDEIDNYRNVVEKELAIKDDILKGLDNL